MTSPVDIDMFEAAIGSNFLKCCGMRGGGLFLDVNEGHFYRRITSPSIRFICADINFFPLSEKTFTCTKKPGSKHNHPIPPHEYVEIATFRWACRLRVLHFHETEAILQSIQHVLMSWPKGLELSTSLGFELSLRKFLLKKNDPHVCDFLTKFNEQAFSRFRDAVFTLPYWNQPGDSGSTLNLSFIKSKLKFPAEIMDVIKTSQAMRKKPCPEFYQQCLLRFEKVIVDYVQVWKRIKEDENKMDALAVAEYLFKPSRLQQWLRYKRDEMNMACMIIGMKGRVAFINKFQLEKQLSQTKPVKYIVILRIPPLNDWTKKNIEKMEQFVNTFSGKETLDPHYDLNNIIEEEESPNVPWHMIEDERKQVLDQIGKLASHVERNQNLLDNVQFSIIVGQQNKQFGSWFIIYENGELLRDKISRLPEPPTGLRIHLLALRKSNKIQKTSVRLEWNYEDLGYPCQFLIEYRFKNTINWQQTRTTNLDGLIQTEKTFNYNRGFVMEFRVATETCIGRSQFTQVVNTRPFEKFLSNMSKELFFCQEKTNVTENQKSSEKRKRIQETNVDVKVSKLNIEIIELS